MSEWIRAFEESELEPGGVRVVKSGAAQIAVFRTADGELYAVDNRCPHEGYPLAKGYVTDCVLTCPWHNFKFDLRDGRCVMGDEAVPTFPLRVLDGTVELDVSGPDPEIERARVVESFEQAMWRGKLGQAARDVVRLLRLDVPAHEVARRVAVFDARHGEYGTTHAMPVAVDALAMTQRFEGSEAVLPLMQAVEMASDGHRFRPARERAAPVAPAGDPHEVGRRLAELVEQERAEEAEAVLRGALAAGWGREVIEPWLYRLCAAHFLDFGHALIYQVKVFDLLERVGWEHADPLLGAHLVSIVSGTREDQLPEWLWFRRHLEELDPRLAELAAGARLADPRPLADALLEAEREAMMGAVVRALEAGTALSVLVDALSLAAAERLLRFSIAIDADPTVQEGWLDVTHLVTYANACRHAIARFREPEALRLLLFGCRFVNNARPLDDPSRPRVEPATGSLTDLVDAISRRDALRAEALTAGWLAEGGDVAALRQVFEGYALDDPFVRPIVVAHLIKTCAAAFEEHEATGRPEPLLAVARFAASPVRERRIRRVCHEAIRFVVHHKVPRTLT